MIAENFDKIYKAFRLDIYKHIFSILGKREGMLTAADYFSVETVYLLGNPTISEFARALSISQPNATYRVKSLVEKGYVVKQKTEKKNTYRLAVTDNFLRYYHQDMGYGNFIFHELSERLSEEELLKVDEIFQNFIRQIEMVQGVKKC